MIETTILDYLSARAGVPCHMEVPKTAPDSFVILDKTGGTKDNLLSRATVAIQSYAASLYEAAVLNDHIVKYMEELPENAVNVTKVGINSGGYNFPDTDSKRYRYQAVFDIYYYEEEL